MAGDESVVQELLRAGADVGARSCDGVTPMHDAVSAGHHQVMENLTPESTPGTGSQNRCLSTKY